ncbi:MAG: hypothetical protein QOK16_2081 [Solirubrobacteraceae bacterium]|nr:hypothetical protein [Solirubrobacteraceae bacterium]
MTSASGQRARVALRARPAADVQTAPPAADRRPRRRKAARRSGRMVPGTVDDRDGVAPHPRIGRRYALRPGTCWPATPRRMGLSQGGRERVEPELGARPPRPRARSRRFHRRGERHRRCVPREDVRTGRHASVVRSGAVGCPCAQEDVTPAKIAGSPRTPRPRPRATGGEPVRTRSSLGRERERAIGRPQEHPVRPTRSRTGHLPARSAIETRQLTHPSRDGTTTGPASIR